MSEEKPKSAGKFGPKETRKFKALRIANEILTGVIVIVIVFLFYYLISHFFNFRWDLTAAGHFSLSDTTLKLLNRIKAQDKKVKVTILDRPATSGQQRLKRDRIRDLLEEYHLRSDKKIGLPREINPDQYPGEVKRLGVRNAGTIALEIDEKEEDLTDRLHTRRALIEPFDLWGSQSIHGRDGPREFKGENAISSGLKRLFAGKERVLYFLIGHEEPTLRSKDPRGIHTFTENLELINLTVRSLDLLERRKVPPDADGVVIFGPQKKFLPLEDEILTQYAKEGGRFLIFAEFNTELGIPTLIQFLGVQLGKNLVLEPKTAQEGNLRAPIPRYGKHPIVQDLSAARVSI